MVAILSSLSLLVSSLDFTSFCMGVLSLGLPKQKEKKNPENNSTWFRCSFRKPRRLQPMAYGGYITALKAWAQWRKRWQLWPLEWPWTFLWTESPRLSLAQSWRRTLAAGTTSPCNIYRTQKNMRTGPNQCRCEGHTKFSSSVQKRILKKTSCCLFVPILIVLQDFGGTVGGRWGEQGVLAWPKHQRRSLAWAGVTAQLGGELVGHGGAWRQDGSTVEQSWWEIPARKEKQIEYCFYGYHCQSIINAAAAKAMKLNT